MVALFPDLNHLIPTLFVLLALFLSIPTIRSDDVKHSTDLKIINLADYPVDIYWVDMNSLMDENDIPESSLIKMTSQGPLINGSDSSYNSFTGHKFLVRFTDYDSNNRHRHDNIVQKEAKIDEHNDVTNDDDNGVAIFTKGASSETFQITRNKPQHQNRTQLQAELLTSTSIKPTAATVLFNAIGSQRHVKSSSSLPLSTTSATATRWIDSYNSTSTSTSTSPLESRFLYASKYCGSELLLKDVEYQNCILEIVSDEFYAHLKSMTNMEYHFKHMSDHYRNYTCRNFTRVTSPAISTYDYLALDKKQYTINVLLNHSHAKIWAVDGFISEQECDVLIQNGRPKLSKAMTAGADGVGEYNAVRKAQQAAYDVHTKGDKDPLWPLYTKIFALSNHHTSYNLTVPGQEPFINIQYNPTDEYRAHCDGDCGGYMHENTGRVATAVLYCKVPEQGGATTFTRADLIVQPKKGSVTFFSYLGADGRMDPEQLTEHSGCPVTQGEKWITTFWMRKGVTATEDWSKYDPKGYRIGTRELNTK